MKIYSSYLNNTVVPCSTTELTVEQYLNKLHCLNTHPSLADGGGAVIKEKDLNQKNIHFDCINNSIITTASDSFLRDGRKQLKNEILNNKEYFNNKNNQIYNIINNLYANKVLLLINKNSLKNQNKANYNIIEYLKTLISYKTTIKKRGVFIKYNKIISYNFNKNKIYDNNTIIQNITILLNTFFKSMYCLISKPKFLISQDKITIQLFYYINIPKYRVFKWFSIYYNKKIRQIFLINNKKEKVTFIKWKLRKSILKLKSKSLYIKKLIFKLFKYNISKVYSYKFKIFCEILSKQLNKPIELELIRLHHPYHDSNILVNLLALNFKNKRKKSRVAIQKIYNKNKVKNLNDLNILSNKINNVPAFLSGLNINIAGRLMREHIIPRITNKVYEKGAIATGKVNFIDSASITKKNRKGAYTIKISSAQNFF
jgi:hypothetical protein